MTTCTGCAGEAADAFLCRVCVSELKSLLLSLACGGPSQHPGKGDLPGLLAELESTSVGQSKLSEPVRRSNREPPGLQELAGLTRYRDVYQSDGDDNPIGLYPNDDETDLGRAREQREKAIRRRLLSAGRCNEYAADLADEIHHCLRMWCVGKGGLAIKHRRLLAPPPTWVRPANEYRFTTTDFTLWLVQAVHLIALDEDAGHFLRSVKGFVHRINKVIDRAEEPLPCGKCPTVIDLGRKGKTRCNTKLEALPRIIEVTCPKCQCTYKVDWLRREALAEAGSYPLRRSEILKILSGFKDIQAPLSPGTFDTWRNRGRLIPIGWRHKDARAEDWHEIRLTTDDKPVYRMAAVLALIVDTTRKATA